MECSDFQIMLSTVFILTAYLLSVEYKETDSTLHFSVFVVPVTSLVVLAYLSSFFGCPECYGMVCSL